MMVTEKMGAMMVVIVEEEIVQTVEVTEEVLVLF